MATTRFSLRTSRPRALVGVVFVLLASSLVPSQSSAQVKLDLDARIKFLHDETALDSVEVVRLDVLTLGEHHKVPNFLTWDFRREHIVEEFSLDGRFRIVFRHPRTQRFGFDETRDGAFIVIQPRDLNTPGLTIEVESVDDVADRIRRESTQEVWRATTVESVVRRRRGEGRRGGTLNIPVPLPLPGVVESIIGEGDKTNIDISGRESISIAGESRIVDPFIGVEGQQKQSLFPALDLRQELDIRLQGQIGEKVHVQVDHSSNAIGPLSNRIRLDYKGFEDDIVKLVELGNTSLTLPGSQLVSFSGQAKGLFGVKVLAQVGPMDLTVIASKEEGETSSASFTPRGGTIGQTEERRIRSIDFVKNTYFFLDNPFDPIFQIPGVAELKRPIPDSLDVYVSVTPQEVQLDPLLATTRGLAFVDTSTSGDGVRQAVADFKAGLQPNFQSQLFVRLVAGEDYFAVLDVLTNLVIGVELVRSIPNNKVLAVSYANRGGDVVGSTWDPSIADAEGDTLYLELIKPIGANPSDEFGYTWQYMMRNIYNLGLSSIDRNTLEVEIEDRVGNRLNSTIPAGSTVPWIRVYGLDRTDQFGTGPPDNRIDLTEGRIDFTRGTLTFPSLTPFNQSDALTAVFADTFFSFNDPPYTNARSSELYEQDPTNPEDFHFFDILVRAQSTTRTFRIDAFNITPNSESVKLDGRTLQRGTDYTINYETGEVELTGDVLDDLTPSSNITIDYEFLPIAGGGGTTLMGFNSVFNISENSKVGTTWLYESKGSASTRPRLGEEPTRAIVGDINTTLNFAPNFLTDLVNLLPLVDSEARSIVSVVGEVAMSMPDPNTRGEVYIEDFEGIEDSDVISMSRRNWNPASPPVNPQDTLSFGALSSADNEKVFWYNIEPEFGVHRRDLNPALDERESTLVPSLDIEIDAFTSGDSTSIDSTHWVGVMTGFRAGGLDLTQGQFIEVWINDFKQDEADRGGILRIDLGRIDENFYNPDLNEHDLEDRNFNGFVAGDSDLSEDTGLDGVHGRDGDNIPGDDGDDDWEVSRQGGRFSRINGTEQNGREDDEDIDGSGLLDRTDSFFSYEIDLASQPVIDVIKEFPGHQGLNDLAHRDDSWRLYRVKLSDHATVDKDGAPNFQQIKHARIWFDHIDKVVRPDIGRIQIVDLKIVGNRWERDGIRSAVDDKPVASADSTELTLGVINTKADPEYTPPINPNVRDDISEKEQSLLVRYDNIEVGQGIRVRKRFLGQGLDFTQYRDFNHFVHTDRFATPPDSVEYYMQIAFDSLNFYEIRMPLTPEFFATGWSRVLIKLNDLTDMKFQPGDSVVTATIADEVDPSRLYPVRMVGRPNLFNVRFLYAGLRNKSGQRISGTLWINDIYLGDRRRDIDFAQRFSSTINMGNVVTLTGSWARTGPDFRGLRQRRGTGLDRRFLTLSAKTNVKHFIPLFGFNIPLSGNYNRSLSLPKWVPNSDTEIEDDALRDSLRTEASTRGFSATLTRGGSSSRILRYTVDKTKVNYSLSQSRSRSPAAADTSVSMSGTLDYSIQWGGRHDIRLFRNVKLRYWPNSMNLRFNARRNKGQRWRNVGGTLVADPKFFSARLDETGSMRWVPFRSLTSTYRLTINRDAALPHTWLGIDIGTEVSRNQNLQLNFKPPPMWGLRAFKPDINYGVGYNENASPNVARPGDPEGTRNASNNRNLSVRASYDLGRYARRFLSRWNLVDAKKPVRAPPAQRPAPQDTTGSSPADTTGTEEKKPADRLIAVKKLAGFITSFRRINASYQQRFSSNYTRIGGRPSILYQLGLSENSGVEGFRDGEPVAFDSPNRAQKVNSFSFDTGIQITRNIDLAGRFRLSLTDNSFREVNTASVSESNAKATTWPDLNLSWKGLEELGLFRKLFRSTSATLAWQKRSRESGRAGKVLSKNETRTISPAIVFAWKNGLSSNLSMQHTRTTAESRNSFNETTQFSVTADLKYAFEGGRNLPLPFLRGKVLRSRLDTNLSMGYTRKGGKRSTGSTGFFVPVPKTTTINVSPRATYSFTRALNGSLFINYSRLFAEATGQTTTVLRIGIDAIFTF